MWQTRYSPIAAALLIAVSVFTAAFSVQGKSTTWDEPYHFTAGLAQLQTGDPRFNFDHPPLARMFSALPALFLDAPSVADSNPEAWRIADTLNAPNAVFGAIEDRLLAPARLMMLSFSVLLAYLMYAWGSRMFGPERALLPLALMVFCPPFLANAPLVTTDMAATTLIFASFYAWWRYLHSPSWAGMAWTCLAVASALAAKSTALLLAPLFTLLGLVALFSTDILEGDFSRRLQITGGALLIIALATLAGIDAIYFFDGVFLKPADYLLRSHDMYPSLQDGAVALAKVWPAWLPVPLPYTYVCGLMSLIANVGQQGHWSYFLGQAGNGGWPNFFLMLLLIKLPLSTLVLLGLGISKACGRLGRDGWNLLFLVSLPLLLIWTASSGKMQIGIRHILPAFPFLFLLTGYCLPRRLNCKNSVFVGVLAGLSAISALSVYPHFLMYYNFLGGGPEQGWRISINSEDWGQGDADLKHYLQQRGIKRVAYNAAGWGAFTLYRAGIIPAEIPCRNTGELVAIHAYTLLTPLDFKQYQCYGWMREREPDAKIGYNIFIYNNKNIKPSAPDDQALFSEALKLQLKGRLKEAIPVYIEYLKQEPDYFQAHFNLACALMDTQQCPAAIPEFQRTLALWPGYKEAHLYLARCYKEAGELGKALEHQKLSVQKP